MEVSGVFTPHFMTLFVYLTPIEIATRLFEIFIIDGENALVRILLRMVELKQTEILRKTDTDLQHYLFSGMVTECVEEFPIGYLLDF